MKEEVLWLFVQTHLYDSVLNGIHAIIYQFPFEPSSCFFFRSSSFGRVNIRLLLSLISWTARWKLLPFSWELMARNLFWQTTNLCLKNVSKYGIFKNINKITVPINFQKLYSLAQLYLAFFKTNSEYWMHIHVFEITTGKEWHLCKFSKHFPPFLAYFSNCSNCSCNCIAESSFLSWNFRCISPTTFWYLVLALLFWNSISCGELKRNKN